MIRKYNVAECDICGAWEKCKYQDYDVSPSMSLPDGWRYGKGMVSCFCPDCSKFLSTHPKFSQYFK